MDFTSEQRLHVRKPCNEAIKFTPLKDSNNDQPDIVTAQVVDISSTGMGIKLNYNLKKGQTVSFVENQPNWDLPRKGLVVWSLNSTSLCSAGLEFLL